MTWLAIRPNHTPVTVDTNPLSLLPLRFLDEVLQCHHAGQCSTCHKTCDLLRASVLHSVHQELENGDPEHSARGEAQTHGKEGDELPCTQQNDVNSMPQVAQTKPMVAFQARIRLAAHLLDEEVGGHGHKRLRDTAQTRERNRRTVRICMQFRRFSCRLHRSLSIQGHTGEEHTL